MCGKVRMGDHEPGADRREGALTPAAERGTVVGSGSEGWKPLTVEKLEEKGWEMKTQMSQRVRSTAGSQ